MKFTTDFTTGVMLRALIEEEIKASLNAIPVFICKESNHPDDDYLHLYVARKGDTYIAGLANTSRGGRVGLYENHYGCTFKQAMEITTNKINDFNEER